MNGESIALLCLKILAVAALVLLNGFFVAAEFALVRIRETQLRTLIAKGKRRARIAHEVLRNLDASLSACQFGITLASLGLGWVGEPIFSALLQPFWPLVGMAGPEFQHVRHTVAVIVGFSAITFLHITAGEQAPKWLAIQRPLMAALFVAQPLSLFHKASYPFIWLLNHASLWLLRRMGVEPVSEAEMAHSEEELRLLLTASQKHSRDAALGRNILLNALDLRHRIAREVMRPRRDIVGLNTEATLAECLDVADKTRYSRFPLCEGGDLDRALGVVHIKDLYAMRHRARTGLELAPIARRIIYVPETAHLERILRVFLDRKLHLAIVVDEFGGTVGMVTLENILEELVGQIQDEFDQEKPRITKTGERSWDLEGTLPLHELAHIIGEPLREEGVATVAGLVTQRMGGFPREGDKLPLGAYELSVAVTEGLVVKRLRLVKLQDAPPPG